MPHDEEAEVAELCAALHELGAELAFWEKVKQQRLAVERSRLRREREDRKIDKLLKKALKREWAKFKAAEAAKTAAAPPLPR